MDLKKSKIKNREDKSSKIKQRQQKTIETPGTTIEKSSKKQKTWEKYKKLLSGAFIDENLMEQDTRNGKIVYISMKVSLPIRKELSLI